MIRVGVCFDFTAHQICQPFQISCLPAPEHNGQGRAYKRQGKAASVYGTKVSAFLLITAAHPPGANCNARYYLD